MQAQLLWSAGTALAVAAVATIADWRRASRRDLDRVGFMPWTLIQLFAFLIAVVLAALAIG